jgi:hypothetical protein
MSGGEMRSGEEMRSGGEMKSQSEMDMFIVQKAVSMKVSRFLINQPKSFTL